MSTTHALHPETSGPAPVILMLRLLRRLHRVAPEFSLSLGLLLGWTRDEIAQRNAAARAALAIDDPLEAGRRTIERCLANEPRHVARRVRAMLAETHARTQALARALEVKEAEEEMEAGQHEPSRPNHSAR